MNNFYDARFSTTKLLSIEKPEIINNPEDKFESADKNKKISGGLRTKGFFKKKL